MDKEIENSIKLVNLINNGENLKAHMNLEKILKEKCRNRINKTIEEINKKEKQRK